MERLDRTLVSDGPKLLMTMIVAWFAIASIPMVRFVLFAISYYADTSGT